MKKEIDETKEESNWLPIGLYLGIASSSTKDKNNKEK